MAHSSNPEIPCELLNQYLERRIEDVRLCEDSLENKDFKTISFIAHNIKGNGASFGFPEISFFGKELEECMKDKDMQAAQDIIAQFSNYIHVEFKKLGTNES